MEVRAPDEVEAAVGQVGRGQVTGGPHDGGPALAFAGGAEGALQAAGAQGVEKTLAAVALDGSHIAGVGVWKDGNGAVPGDKGFPAGGELFNGLFPGNRDKLARALGTHPPHGPGQAVRAVYRSGEFAHLGAEKTIGIGIIRVAGDFDHPALFHLDQQGAAIGAVIGAGGAVNGHGETSFGWGCIIIP